MAAADRFLRQAKGEGRDRTVGGPCRGRDTCERK